MRKTTHIIIAHGLMILFLLGCVKACDTEYANQDAMIKQYISPNDQMLIDWQSPNLRNTPTKD
ncbi:hypothetical protein [Moraxella lincolnii]|uniref:Uncharacterized protein n=1 Tax=Lwoffella lincolnii TaxID=90241 RepID=A0A1T0CK78_9GAMM|nr:hypothetical protein [Moraxella lincolnii]OOS22747.1 hypothetical protein B0682_00545 [Moraxella lincolnii]